MGVWSSIGGAVCVAVTVLGLVWSYRIWRKDGVHRGMRAIAWSLIPVAAYLTGAVGLIGRLVNAVVIFAGSIVFSPKTYAGVIVVIVAVLLFVLSGGLPLAKERKARKRRKAEKAAARAQRDSGQPAAAAGRETKAVEPRKHKAPVPGGKSDDDMSDIEEILRRRGIN
jgi:cytochrome c oxidase assembly factor CtaG